MSSSVGKEFRSKGFQKNKPVLIIPGLCSSAMQVVETPHPEWEGKRVWLDLTSLMPMAFERKKKSKPHLPASRPASPVAPNTTGDSKSSRMGTRDAPLPHRAVVASGASRTSAGNADDSLPSKAVAMGLLATFTAEEIETHARKRRLTYLVPGEMDKMDEMLKRKWIQHVMLQNDGISDPEGIKIRPIAGLDGCSYLDPSIGALTSSLSYVFGPLIDIFKSLGYDNDSIRAATYDWRLPPGRLEQRDHFMSNLKATIEDMYHKNQKKRVVLLAHSLGTRVIHYFSRWVHQKTSGQFVGGARKSGEAAKSWWSTYVDEWYAIGPLWMGAPKSLRATLTGERMGLDFFLYEEEGVALSRKCGSTPWMYPCVTPHVEFQNYCHLRVSESNSSAGATVIVGDKGARFESRSIKDILIAGKATNMYKMLQEYYEQDPFYGSPQEYLKPPPVDSIKAIYGVNLPTEIAYFFREANSGSSGGSSDCVTALCLDNDGSIPNYKCEGGIAYETKDTRQNMLRGKKRSGDGTVPYASLACCKYWHNSGPGSSGNGINVQLIELDGADHRAILKNKQFTREILLHCTRPPFVELPARYPELSYIVSMIDDNGRSNLVTMSLTRSSVDLIDKTTNIPLVRFSYGSVTDVDMSEQGAAEEFFTIEFSDSAEVYKFNSSQNMDIVDKIASRCRAIGQIDSADEQSASSRLLQAVLDGRIDLVLQMLNERDVINASDSNGRTPLICASSVGDLDCVLVLLQSPYIDVTVQAKDGNTALHYLVRCGSVPASSTGSNTGSGRATTSRSDNEVVRGEKVTRIWDMVLKKGASVSVPGKLGETPLHQAVGKGNLKAVSWLLMQKASPNDCNKFGESPLHYAVRSNHYGIVSELLQYHAQADLAAANGATPKAIARNMDPAIYQLIMGQARESVKTTPIHVACTENRLDTLFDWIGGKQDVNGLDGNGWRPIHCAASRGSLDALLVLLQTCGIPNSSGDRRSSSTGYPFLLDKFALTNDKCSVLHLLARLTFDEREHPKLLTCLDLLMQGAAPNFIDRQNEEGDTALHLAVSYSSGTMLNWLMVNNASTELFNSNKDTPLHCAVRLFARESIEVLLKNGADPSLSHPSNGSLSPLSLAMHLSEAQMGQDNLLDMFPEHASWGTASRASAPKRSLVVGGQRQQSMSNLSPDRVVPTVAATAAAAPAATVAAATAVPTTASKAPVTGPPADEAPVVPAARGRKGTVSVFSNPNAALKRRPLPEIGSAQIAQTPPTATAASGAPTAASPTAGVGSGGRRALPSRPAPSPARKTIGDHKLGQCPMTPRQQAQQMRLLLESTTVVGESSNGHVRVTANGLGSASDIKVNWTTVVLEGKVETFLLEAINDLAQKRSALLKATMETAGLDKSLAEIVEELQ